MLPLDRERSLERIVEMAAWQTFRCPEGHYFLAPPGDWAECSYTVSFGRKCGLISTPHKGGA